jgi:hypothetical protein
MSLWIFKLGRADTFLSRLVRARNEGYLCGSQEGKLFALAVGKAFTRERALDWLSNVIDDGREELHLQHASDREVQAWDMSCRIALF